MPQVEPVSQPTNGVNIDSKTSVTDTAIDVSDPKSIKTIDQQQQSSSVLKVQLDKAVIQFSSWLVLLQVAVMLATSIVQLYYGIQYQHKCPIQPLINIFLIVHGAAGLAGVVNLILAYIIANYIKRSVDPLPCARYLLGVNLIVQLVLVVFNVAWMVAGQVWVFGAMTNGFQYDNPHQLSTFCYSKVFWPAFVIIFVTYLVWIIMILVFVRKPIMKCIRKRHDIKHETDLQGNRRT
jgi:hypothetical protein